jgi:hypothetical protein
MTSPNPIHGEPIREAPDLSARAAGIGVALATLLALVLRIVGIDFMLPHLSHVDERIYACQVDLFRDLAPLPGEIENYAFYPELVPWLASVTTPSETLPPPGADLEAHRRAGAAKFVSLRITVAWLSVLLVPATYFLARRFLTRRVALTAAWFAAASVLFLWHAQQARPHAALATTTAAAVLGALMILRRGDWRAYMIAGLALGMAVATLQSGLAALPALCAAHVLRRHDRKWRAQAFFLAALAVCFVSARVFYPFVFDSGTGQIELGTSEIGRRVALSGHGVHLAEFNGRGFAPISAALVGFDPLIALFAAVGLATCVASLVRARFRPERWRELLVVLAFALPYLLMIGMWQRSYQRFLLPLYPCLAILAAAGVWWIAERVGRRRLVVSTVVAVVLGLQTLSAATLSNLRRAPDTATEAADWIAAHLARTDRIVIAPTLELPLLRQDRGLVERANAVGREYRPWPRYQLTLPPDERRAAAFDLYGMPLSERRFEALLDTDPAAYLREVEADYVVVQEFGPHIRARLGKLREAVKRSGTLVARFSPWRADRSGDTPLVYYWDSEFAAEDWLAWRLCGMRSLGAPVEIYRVNR